MAAAGDIAGGAWFRLTVGASTPPSPRRPHPHLLVATCPLLARPAPGRSLGLFIRRLDQNSRAYFAYIFTARWLGFRLDLVVIILLTASCLASVIVHEYSGAIGESTGLACEAARLEQE